MKPGSAPYIGVGPRSRGSSSVRKPLQTSRHDSQNYGFREGLSRTAPTKRRCPPDSELGDCQRSKKPRLDYDSVVISNRPDATSSASRIRKPPRDETFFDISAIALQQMLRSGNSLRIGTVKSMDPAFTSPRPSFRYDAVEKTFIIFAHGVKFTLSATDSPQSSFGPARPASLDGNTQKTHIGVPKDIQGSPATTTNTRQEQNANDWPSIGSKFRALANTPRESTVARLRRASGDSSTLLSRRNADSGDVCVANKNVSGAAMATLSPDTVPNIDNTGIRQSRKRSSVIIPGPSKRQAKDSMTGQDSAAQHLHKGVSRKTTAPFFETALDPNAAPSRTNVDGTSIRKKYTNNSQRKHLSGEQPPPAVPALTRGVDRAASLKSIAANTRVAGSTAQRNPFSANGFGRVSSLERKPDDSLPSYLQLDRDPTFAKPPRSMGTVRATDISGCSRKMEPASTSLPHTTNSQSGKDGHSHKSSASENLRASQRSRNTHDTQHPYHPSSSEHSSESEDSDSCEIITKPEGYSWRQPPPPESKHSRRHNFLGDDFPARLDLDNNGFEADRDLRDQKTYVKLRGLFLPPFEDPYGMETRSTPSDAGQSSVAAQDPEGNSSSGIYDDRDGESFR
ncbi:MAG: hypothetical protein Q9183_005830 [Haloplaca sp. 2 TL-2023]